MGELERCVKFVRALAERRARRIERSHFGKALFHDDLPLVRDLNVLALDLGADPDVDELLADADRLQAGLSHRKISVDEEELGERLAPELFRRGWVVQRLLVMPHAREGRAVDTANAIELEPSEIEPLWREEHRRDGYEEEVARQLLGRRTRTREAAKVRYFAVLEGGAPVSSCELYSDGRVAQIESVGTLEEHRGKGYASAVVMRALEEARVAGNDLVFIMADEDDWPKELYNKLGFETAGRVYDFVKAKELDDARLRAIRLRTPRLELRLASREELVTLAEVAVAGIHPPEEMPFAFPWTDDVTVESFVAHHEEQLAEWEPDDWCLNLVTFLDGSPIGSQSICAESFASTSVVHTGSWLGRRFQGKGLGTEMRAAVLELAFHGLGAVAAESGAMDGNVASRRVSEKLGYQVAGEGVRSPRGEPVREVQFRIARDAWHSPVQVRIEGLEPTLPLFGTTSARSR